MKTISVRDLQKRIRSVMETAQRDQVVITRNGQPVAVVVGVEGADWETLAVETSRSFWKEIALRRDGDHLPRGDPQAASGIVTSERQSHALGRQLDATDQPPCGREPHDEGARKVVRADAGVPAPSRQVTRTWYT